jgi:hypothetical protein
MNMVILIGCAQMFCRNFGLRHIGGVISYFALELAGPNAVRKIVSLFARPNEWLRSRRRPRPSCQQQYERSGARPHTRIQCTSEDLILLRGECVTICPAFDLFVIGFPQMDLDRRGRGARFPTKGFKCSIQNFILEGRIVSRSISVR